VSDPQPRSGHEPPWSYLTGPPSAGVQGRGRVTGPRSRGRSAGDPQNGFGHLDCYVGRLRLRKRTAERDLPRQRMRLGADINWVGFDNRTPVNTAQRSGTDDPVSQFRTFGAKPTASKLHLNCRRPDAVTAHQTPTSHLAG
jgi:hypothetical protein